MPIVNIDGNYTQNVDSFLDLGSLYSHTTAIVGHRLCATLGLHHHEWGGKAGQEGVLHFSREGMHY